MQKTRTAISAVPYIESRVITQMDSQVHDILYKSNKMYDDWAGKPSEVEWIHMCMGSEGCMVAEDGDRKSGARRIAYPILHTDALEIVGSHNRAIEIIQRNKLSFSQEM